MCVSLEIPKPSRVYRLSTIERTNNHEHVRSETQRQEGICPFRQDYQPHFQALLRTGSQGKFRPPEKAAKQRMPISRFVSVSLTHALSHFSSPTAACRPCHHLAESHPGSLPRSHHLGTGRVSVCVCSVFFRFSAPLESHCANSLSFQQTRCPNRSFFRHPTPGLLDSGRPDLGVESSQADH